MLSMLDLTANATTFLKTVAAELLAPFRSWETVFASSTGVIKSVTDLSSKTAWLYLLSSFVIAWVIYLSARRRGLVDRDGSFMRFICPADVYRQRSAIVDYKFVAVD